MKNYQLLEHTADIYVRVRGKNLRELFKRTAIAMFDVVAEKKLSAISCQSSAKKIDIKLEAQDLEELFVNWLNELLSLSAAKEVIFTDFKINKLDKKRLEAEAAGESAENYRFNTEIKAATYHQLKIKKGKSGWLAEVIFDV